MSSIGTAYKGIDDLSAAAAAAGTNSIAVVQGVAEKEMTLTQLATFMAANLGTIAATSVTATTLSSTNVNISNDLTIAEAGNIILGTTTGTKIGTTSAELLSVFGVDPVNKGDALTVADAVALDSTYNVTEQTTMSNMRIRINELEVRIQDFGITN